MKKTDKEKSFRYCVNVKKDFGGIDYIEYDTLEEALLFHIDNKDSEIFSIDKDDKITMIKE